jgi:hypothetical protein
MRSGIRPLTPIFNPEKKTGSVIVGNTPGAPYLRLIGTVTDATQLNGPKGMAVYGSHLAVVCLGGTDDGITMLDMTDPTNPTVVGYAGKADEPDLDNPRVVTVIGDYAVVWGELGWFFVVDISDPTDPTFVGSFQDTDWGTGTSGIGTDGTSAYVSKSDRFGVIDISTPASPTLSGEDIDGSNYGLSKKLGALGSNVFVPSNVGNSLTVVDPTGPTIDASVADATRLNFAESVVMYGTYAIVNADGWVVVVDVSDPDNPAIVGSLDITDWFFVADITISGVYAVVVGTRSFTSLGLISLINPAAPVLIYVYEDTSGTILDTPDHIATHSGNLVVSDSGLDVVQVFEIVNA